jgi:hypothetical protein
MCRSFWYNLPVPPHYQNYQAVLDAFNTAFGEGGDGSVSDHRSTGCGIAAMFIADAHGRGRRVLGGRRGRRTAGRGRGSGRGGRGYVHEGGRDGMERRRCGRFM